MKKAFISLFLLLWACLAIAADPYYMFIRNLNPNLTPAQVGTILAANREFSKKYNVSMYWHVAKTAHESKFTPEKGTAFEIAGRRYNSEPCYGIEAIQVDAVRDMYPNLSESQIENKLMKDFRFAIEASYRLDYANQISANKRGYTSKYQQRVVSIIMYNAGRGNWANYHQGLAKWLREGKELEDMTLRDWAKYKLNFRELFSLNYYTGVLRRAMQLDYYLNRYTVIPTPSGS